MDLIWVLISEVLPDLWMLTGILNLNKVKIQAKEKATAAKISSFRLKELSNINTQFLTF